MFEKRIYIRVFNEKDAREVHRILDGIVKKGRIIEIDHNPDYGMFKISVRAGIIERRRCIKELKDFFNTSFIVA